MTIADWPVEMNNTRQAGSGRGIRIEGLETRFSKGIGFGRTLNWTGRSKKMVAWDDHDGPQGFGTT